MIPALRPILARFGKSLEARARRLRPYLNPAYRRAYRSLVARGMSQRRPGEPIVCCDFSDPAIDAVGGRYTFSLVHDLIAAGYFPVFVARRQTLSTFGAGGVKSLLLAERLGVVTSAEDLREPFLFITDTAEKPPAPALRVIRVDYARRLPDGPDEIPLPFFAHPRIATGTALPFPYDPDATRPVRLFFGGNTSGGKYDQDIIRDVYAMLNRREMLAIACEEFPPEKIHRPGDAAVWLASPGRYDFVLCETQHCKIPAERWIEALSKADFFLACPGVGMPLCHNLIEAMAAGAIPILQYGRYLTPPLRDGVDCLSFEGRDSLERVVKRATSMDVAEIKALRIGTRAYYETNLAPGRFTNLLGQGLGKKSTLLVNAYRVPR